eukprot:10008370-Prorocentrum_lima.AAC.1
MPHGQHSASRAIPNACAATDTHTHTHARTRLKRAPVPPVHTMADEAKLRRLNTKQPEGPAAVTWAPIR